VGLHGVLDFGDLFGCVDFCPEFDGLIELGLAVFNVVDRLVGEGELVVGFGEIAFCADFF
jgi:hypothetical protein